MSGAGEATAEVAAMLDADSKRRVAVRSFINRIVVGKVA
jgi:hypothetical protein